MKIIHCLSIGGFIIAAVLYFAGFAKISGLLIALITLIELVGSAVTGKQTNTGVD